MAEAMELKDFLLQLFPNTNDVRYSEILDEFSKISINSISDLEFIDEEDIKQLKCLTRIEAKKLISYFSKKDSETLDQVLSQIFIGTPLVRLPAIKNVLIKEEIYTGKDVLVIDTNKLRKEGALSNTELLKIEQYIKKNDKERFDDIRVEKTTNDKKELIEYEAKMASQQIQLQSQVKMIEDSAKGISDEIRKLSHQKEELNKKVGDSETFTRHVFGFEIHRSTYTPTDQNLKHKDMIKDQISVIDRKIEKLKLDLDKKQVKLKKLCQQISTEAPLTTASGNVN